MSVIDTLVTDRATADITALTALRTKIKNRTATLAEWTEWLIDSKGAYSIGDANRVGTAIAYLAARLNSYGYSVTVSPKTDWVTSDDFTVSDATAYLADLVVLKSAFYGTTTLPADMDGLTVTEANNIELLLTEIEAKINNMVSGFRKCGTFKSGQSVILP